MDKNGHHFMNWFHKISVLEIVTPSLNFQILIVDFSHRLSFSSVGTVVFTILAAFASKIVLQDLNMD